MIAPQTSRLCPSTGIRLDNFAADRPKPPRTAKQDAGQEPSAGLIDGLTVTPLVGNADNRGSLFELLTTRDGQIEPIVHVYQVAAAPGSIRAWVYHRHQYDRLAYTMGQFEIALYDARPDSRTANLLNVFALSAQQPALMRIPPFVIHGVRNAAPEWGFFTNMPTRPYFRNDPDKSRLPYGDPRVPYTFDAR
jgi:dTDP-4-dehydrorhamnose 3,5-epimerase